jgi:peroxiredoxin (alkyl hydroperoxide reductase subunit C)
MLTVGDQFPTYSAKACVGADPEALTEVSNDTHEGRWAVYFFYPKDFTFVCPTEIVAFNKKLREFKDRDCEVFGGSTDNEYSHLAWCRSHDDLRDLRFPLIAAQKLAAALGILDPVEGVCLRATFLVDPDGVIQYAAVNNLNVGRNVDEVLRVLDAVQSDELCPCNWKKGEATIQV